VTIAAPLTRTFRRALSLWGLALLGVLAALVFTTLTGVGGSPVRVVVVAGESMLPTLDSGDAVLTLRRSGYDVGDIVAYRVPAGEPGAGTVVIHRIVRTTPEGFLLQGDNNEGLDPWTPGQGEIVGERTLTIPQLGLVVGFLRTALGAALIAAFVTFLIALDAGERKRSGRTA
jgi:signal peptidase